MLHICDHPHCTTLTIGSLCIAHEPPTVALTFPRGRPFAVGDRRTSASTDPQQWFDDLLGASAVSLGSGTKV